MRTLAALGKVFGAAVLLASALTLPAMAQEVIRDPGKCAQFYPNANCENYGPGNPYRDSYYHPPQGAYRSNRTAPQDAWNAESRPYRDRSGDGAAGAIAAAPFRGAYAYDSGYGYNSGWNGQSYPGRNGLVCTPGQYFEGADGRRHLCQ